MQEVLVEILLEECGDRLAPPVFYTGLPPSNLPSPDELRGKILVKARKRRAAPHEMLATIEAVRSAGDGLRASDKGSRFSEAVSAIQGLRFQSGFRRFQSAVRKFTWLQSGFRRFQSGFRLFATAEPVAPDTAPGAHGTAPESAWSRFRHNPAFGTPFRQRSSPPSVPPSPPESALNDPPECAPRSVPPGVSPPESALNDAPECPPPECPPSPIASRLSHWISEAGRAITQSFKHPGAPFASHASAHYGATIKHPDAMLGATGSVAAPVSSSACGRSMSAVSGSMRGFFGIDAQHGALSRRQHEEQYDEAEDDEGEGGHTFTSHYPSAAHHVLDGRHVFVRPLMASDGL